RLAAAQDRRIGNRLRELGGKGEGGLQPGPKARQPFHPARDLLAACSGPGSAEIGEESHSRPLSGQLRGADARDRGAAAGQVVAGAADRAPLGGGRRKPLSGLPVEAEGASDKVRTLALRLPPVAEPDCVAGDLLLGAGGGPVS